MFEFLIELIRDYGYFGIFALMVLENLFPPIPSELIVPLAGFICAQGGMDPTAVVFWSTAGAVVGAMPWYFLGRIFGLRRAIAMVKAYGIWLTVDLGELRRSKRIFNRYGWAAVLFGRLVPAVRTLISIPAGVARMGFARFLVLTTVGSVAWNIVLTAAGYQLEERYTEVQHVVDPITKGIVVLVVGIYLFRLVFQFRQRRVSTCS